MTVPEDAWKVLYKVFTGGPEVTRYVLAYGAERSLKIEWFPRHVLVTLVQSATEVVPAVPVDMVFSVGLSFRQVREVCDLEVQYNTYIDSFAGDCAQTWERSLALPCLDTSNLSNRLF